MDEIQELSSSDHERAPGRILHNSPQITSVAALIGLNQSICYQKGCDLSRGWGHRTLHCHCKSTCRLRSFCVHYGLLNPTLSDICDAVVQRHVSSASLGAVLYDVTKYLGLPRILASGHFT